MAVVYMAEQEEPIRRKVALKIIKLGMDTKSVIARFEAERQALAMMNHPNIAKVLDAGATEMGRPYFVMELVTGVSITQYCDKNRLSTGRRLDLFVQVCSAVHHAHQKGIIHRDIKPTNVMVTLHDGKPVPKVIDFGIAKATSQKLTEKTLFTRYGHMVGTPAYMSPEQAEMSGLDVDTRTDVYSLGVLLYELLTGATPFSEAELREAGYLQMQKIICEAEPTKPSTKLSTLGEGLTDVAKRHSSSPEVMRRLVRGDLDWIVMKTLEKDRSRRYDSASALGADVQRHLDNEPILARAPGTVYCLRKFFRRHRIHVAVSLVVSVLAVTLLAVFLVWNHKQRLWEAERFLMDKTTLSCAIDSLFYGDLGAALADVESVLDSKYVGSEAHHRHDEILARIRKRVRSCTEKIEANPEDAQSYLLRAQQYYCLREKENMIADMEMYVNVLNSLDETNPHDLWFRDFLIGLWQSTPTNLGQPVNSSEEEWGSSLSPDGLSLYFESNRPGGEGKNDIWVSTRATREDDWGAPVNLGAPINTSAIEQSLCISADGLELYFNDHPLGRRAGSVTDGGDLWVATRATVSDPWGEPENLGSTINSDKWEVEPEISPDGRSLLFCSNRDGGHGDFDIWQVDVHLVVDLNGDGVVNSADMTAMVNHWGEDYPSCDIGPMPWGDGIVDVEDLIVLSEHLFEDVDDATLVAHWPLDETEGITAHDNANGYDDYIIGGAVWQPAGGAVGGALELDGGDDCLIATVGPNPADPEISSGFSVFAWIKGGAPGQVIISQPLGANLLALNAEGKLMTDFGSSGQGSVQLESQAVITDGKWHRVSLVWDGSKRTLCVDGIVVAEDTPDGPGVTASGIYIGVGKNYAAGTFFSGLIDDVRIYRRAVKP